MIRLVLGLVTLGEIRVNIRLEFYPLKTRSPYDQRNVYLVQCKRITVSYLKFKIVLEFFLLHESDVDLSYLQTNYYLVSRTLYSF